MYRPTGAFVLWALTVAPWAWAGTLEGHVVCVSDGDTVVMIDAAKQEHSLRLAGIDAPERDQPFGLLARLNLAQAVLGRAVRFEIRQHDRHGRAVGRLLVDGADAAQGLLEQGLAWHYTRYAHEQPEAERRRYAEAEARARQAGLGLWADPNPVPPWEWRKRP